MADLNIVLAPAAGDLEALLAGPEGLVDGLVLLGSVGAPLPARDLEPLPHAAHQGCHGRPPLHRQHHLTHRLPRFGADPDPDPYLWLMDPDLDPAPFFNDFKDEKKIHIFFIPLTHRYIIFCLKNLIFY